MTTRQFTCTVERIIEKDGEKLFVFSGYAGIYSIPKGSPLYHKLAISRGIHQPVTVTVDADLKILDVTE